jgi:type II secretory pathway component GspD/PulD (secretin)
MAVIALVVGLAGAAAIARADELRAQSKADLERVLDERKVSLRLEDTPLDDALFLLRDLTGIAFDVDPSARQAVEAARVSVRLRDAPVRAVLRQLLDQAGTLGYRVEDDRVLVVLKGTAGR